MSVHRRSGWVASFLVLATLHAAPPPAFAQPPGGQMCGDGTTFTVDLPGTTLGIDDSAGGWRNIDVPDKGPDDSVTLPNGCRIYAILVSGFNQNADRDAIEFYKVAEWVAAHDGYVHVSWWNNLLKEYMGRPLHPATIRVRKAFGDDIVMSPSPGDGFGGFAPGDFDRPKANPDDDFQFQSDAERVIRAIKFHNPNAIVMVVGHSMGGGAIARLGMNRGLAIDLLAPIDPVNNRDMPRGTSGAKNDNWNRWRVNHQFKGYRQWDCVREDGLCKDHDPRVLFKEYRCAPTGPFLNVRPTIASLAPLVCPKAQAYVDPGTLLGFGSNIKRLYHRWQYEYLFPFDYRNTERFSMYAARTTSLDGPNHQQPVEDSVASGDPDKTCTIGDDPRDSKYNCSDNDGHGEIVGYRGVAGRLRPAMELRDHWPSDSADRKEAFVALASATKDEPWRHRPENPDLCMVCDDIIAIAQRLYDEQPAPPSDTTAPNTLVTATPDPNDHGWNNEDVVLDFRADDEANGSGVSEIQTSLTGAQPGGGIVEGDTAQETIAIDGTTTASYSARDHAGNTEAAKALVLRLDKTPPQVSAAAQTPANADGWHNTDVTVGFTAIDVLSGIATVSDPIVVTAEGAEQEIVGTAADLADNQASASTFVSIDKTPPLVSAHLSEPPNAAGWHRGDVLVSFSATDALSGVSFVSEPVLVTSEGRDQPITGIATDAAGNAVSTTVRISIDKTPPEALLEFDPVTRGIVIRGRDQTSAVGDGAIAPRSVNPLLALKKGFVSTHEAYDINDLAGNTLTITLDLWRSLIQTRVTITTLDYGSGPRPAPVNLSRFLWTTSSSGTVKVIEQRIDADEERRLSKSQRVVLHKVQGYFSAKRDSTVLHIKSPAPATTETRPGLVLIRLTTDRGRLRAELP